MNKRLLFFFASMLVLTLPACVSSGRSGGGDISAQVQRHEQQIQGLLSQVGQVEQVLPGQAEMWSQMQTMRQELNMINGKLDEMQVGGAGDTGALREQVNRLDATIRKMASQLNINVSDLGAAGTPPAPYTPPSYTGGGLPPAVNNTPPAPAASVSTANALYNKGISAFDQRRYQDAVVSFKDFVAAYPKDNLASNAHFWQGESYFQLKDYARAALAYQEVIANYPGSNKIQASMFKQGVSLFHANKKSAAQQRLQELVQRYPNSPEATRAKSFITENKL